MKYFLGLTAITSGVCISSVLTTPLSAQTQSNLLIVYPPPEHQTVSKKIFFIGTAIPNQPVFINGKPIRNRSNNGHFAPSLPLKMGKNIFKIRQQDQEVRLEITRISDQPAAPPGLAFAEDSLVPKVDIARMPDEPICFGAVAPPKSNVSAQLGSSRIVLMPQIDSVNLPPNSAVLTAENKPEPNKNLGRYEGCTTLDFPFNYGRPIFEIEENGKTITKEGAGEINILSPKDIKVVEVIADQGVARTGASTTFSRLTPLPKGTRARVTGKEGDWFRLDYGGWIKAEETKPVLGNIPPQSLIRGVTSKIKQSETEIVFPLQIPVPIEVKQTDSSITLTLHNTTAQTDTIRLDADPLIKRLDWQQVSPTKLEYTFELNTKQQWGYDLSYQDTSLIFSLRHPPETYIKPPAGSMKYLDNGSIQGKIIRDELPKPLKEIKILLDPGHGGAELGAKGPTGYPEKEINLHISKLIKQELTRLGATVYLTRDKDKDVSLAERVAMIDKIKPDLALSIHYNALPDSGNAEKTKGISTFWYNTQAHQPAMFLHNYLVTKLNRPDQGTFWNNLALTRPHSAPAILLELGFMINPEEFEWITNAQAQDNLAKTVAQGVRAWFDSLR